MWNKKGSDFSFSFSHSLDILTFRWMPKLQLFSVLDSRTWYVRLSRKVDFVSFLFLSFCILMQSIFSNKQQNLLAILSRHQSKASAVQTGKLLHLSAPFISTSAKKKKKGKKSNSSAQLGIPDHSLDHPALTALPQHSIVWVCKKNLVLIYF